MRAGQVSFAAGEISPLLHARVDLAKYHTALAELVNMIVLPQGGITRRAGFSELGRTMNNMNTAHTVKLIPFEYNRTDSELVEFGGGEIRVWQKNSEGYAVACSLTSPYAIEDVKDLRYVQSGNVIFLTHRNYKPQMLKRDSLTSWSIQDLPYKNGAWVSGSEWADGAKLTLSGIGKIRTVKSAEADVFSEGLEGTLLKIEYAVNPEVIELTSEASPSKATSQMLEVKGTLNVLTSGEWLGTLSVERSADSGVTWITVRQYVRKDTSTQGQWDFTITETEEGVFYRVTAEHDAETTTTAATVSISASGFLKSEVYKIDRITDNRTAIVELQGELAGRIEGLVVIADVLIDSTEEEKTVSLWSMGAWGEVQGYPGACTMYQDRLVLAGSTMQPQTIWMSRTGDYADFGTSDPLSDDDAVTMTLAGSSTDRIHSLTASSDLLAFTSGGEWRIRGAGDSGAITPTALTAHQQTNIGTKDIQPLIAGQHVIIVQAQGRKVYALGYSLDIDGYSGSELTILSGHMFEGKRIVDMAYQSEPDSLLWFTLDDGTCAVCTYNPEHDVTGWSRHEITSGKVKVVASLTGENMTEIFAVCTPTGETQKVLYYLRDRREEVEYTDGGSNYESRMRTLRLSDGEAGAFTSKKLAARLTLSVVESGGAWAAPGDYSDAHSWERRRKITMDKTEYLQDKEVQLDNGFSEDACIQVRSMDNEPLTIAAVTPHVTIGGQ